MREHKRNHIFVGVFHKVAHLNLEVCAGQRGFNNTAGASCCSVCPRALFLEIRWPLDGDGDELAFVVAGPDVNDLPAKIAQQSSDEGSLPCDDADLAEPRLEEVEQCGDEVMMRVS